MGAHAHFASAQGAAAAYLRRRFTDACPAFFVEGVTLTDLWGNVGGYLSLPLVVKIPDGSFSRGVHKIESAVEFKRICDELFEETDLLLAQKFLPTDFDWRVGVLSGQPLFVCQYRMARGHWQVVKYRPDGSSHEGGFRAFGLEQAPREVIDIAVRAARPIGDGFYGVDLKETDHGIVVMEVNDNPSLEHGIEDTVGKDEIWSKLLRWFIDRFEQ